MIQSNIYLNNELTRELLVLNFQDDDNNKKKTKTSPQESSHYEPSYKLQNIHIIICRFSTLAVPKRQSPRA